MDENQLARDSRPIFTRYVRELWNSRSPSYFTWWANGEKAPPLPLRNCNGATSHVSGRNNNTGWGESTEETRQLLNQCATHVCSGRPEVASFMANYLHTRMPHVRC